MKKIILTLFVLVTSIIFSNARNENKITRLFEQDILYNAQQKMDSLLTLTYIGNKSNTALLEYSNQLKELFKKNKSNLIAYWYAYSKFYLSQSEKNKTLSEKYIDEAVDVLDNLKNKNSEDYALLAHVQAFSLQFINMMKIIFRSKSAKENALKAIELDKNNLRGYFVYASLDYYTPAEYDGGKEYETYLLKAIKLPVSVDINNTYLPTWGLEDSYLLLIQSYFKKKDIDNAKKYFMEGQNALPNSKRLQNLSAKFKN